MTTVADNPFATDIARGEQTAVLAWRDWLRERAEDGDVAAKARLEFCEVQERAETLRADGHGDNCMCLAAMRALQPKSGAQALPTCEECFTLQHAEHDAAALLRENEAAWRASGPCIYCQGRGRGSACDEPNIDGVLICPSCYGTGDRGGLMRTWTLSERHDAGLLEGNDRFSRKVYWREGLPYAVECRLEDVLERACGLCSGTGNYGSATPPSSGPLRCPRCSGTGNPAAQYQSSCRVTEWAKSVVRWHPVERFMLTDRKPNATEYGMTWNRDYSHHASTDGVPSVLFDLMRLGHVGDSYKHADTVQLAADALATAVGVLVRREVWGEINKEQK